MSEACKEHTNHEFRITNNENRVSTLEDRINKHSGKVETAYLKMEIIVSKADNLIKKLDDLSLKYVSLKEKVSGHLNESNFWRAFMCTLACMIIVQLGMFIYAWGSINKTVATNERNISEYRNVRR